MGVCWFLFPLFLFFRLIRGEGEIIEEIVSKERHKDINKVNGKPSKTMQLCVLLWG